MGFALALKIPWNAATLLLPALLLQVPAPKPAEIPPKPAQPPAPKLLEGIEMESALLYDADPKTPHTLRAVFAGKDHARWWIGAGADGAEVRLLRLRSESRVFALRLDSATSVELEGPLREEALSQLELRRALLQYESFEWKGAERERSAALGALGSLRARFDAPTDPRPSEIEFLDPAGKPQDACRSLRWEKRERGFAVRELELWHEGRRIWKETVKRVSATTLSGDAFLPGDPGTAEKGAGSWNVVATPSPEFAARRFELAAGASFESAAKELERLRSEWAPKLAALGLELENRGTLELDEQLRPRCVVLRLAKLPEKLPEGFERVAGRSAVGTPVDGFERIEASALRALRAKLPAGAKPGAPYVRWTLEPGAGKQVLLLLSWPVVR